MVKRLLMRWWAGRVLRRHYPRSEGEAAWWCASHLGRQRWPCAEAEEAMRVRGEVGGWGRA